MSKYSQAQDKVQLFDNGLTPKYTIKLLLYTVGQWCFQTTCLPEWKNIMADSCKVHTNIWSYNVVQHLCYTMQACHGRIHFLWGHIVHITSTDKAFHHDNIPSATDTRKLFSTFKSLLIPSPLPPATSLTTDTFPAFFTDKVAANSSQFSDLPTQTLLHSFFI